MMLISIWGRALWLVAGASALLFLDASLRPAPAAPALAQMPAVAVHGKPVEAASLKRVAMGAVPMPPGTAAAHASSLLPMPANSPSALSLFWFSGERESGPLVQIAATQWDRASGRWREPRFVVNRHTMGDVLGHGLRRLGNPVAWMDAQGRMHLFVVATGWGGWAASRVLHLRQSSASQNLSELAFEPVRVLPLSWLWNTSFLVRNAVLPLQDGGAVLPVHFELGLKYPSAVRLGADGGFAGMARMSQLAYQLQPTLLARSPSEWIALMRDQRPNGKVTAVRTEDGGAHWQDLPDLPLGNPDAAVAGLVLGPRQMLLAHNPTPEGRAKLELSRSPDGLQWTLQQTLREGAPDAEFSYPAMAWADDALWIAYTVDRATLSWQRFVPGGTP
nr:sialidase family protein [uncultured Rhodoferax sp.]